MELDQATEGFCRALRAMGRSQGTERSYSYLLAQWGRWLKGVDKDWITLRNSRYGRARATVGHCFDHADVAGAHSPMRASPKCFGALSRDAWASNVQHTSSGTASQPSCAGAGPTCA